MAPFENTDQHLKRAKSRRLMFGLLAIFFGGLWLLKNLHIFTGPMAYYLFKWSTIVLAIGLIGLSTNRENAVGYTIMVFIGGFFLLDRIYGIRENFSAIFWPSLMIAIGISLLMKLNSASHYDKKFKKNVSSTDELDNVAILSGNEIKITSKSFSGGQTTAILGGTEIDFTDSELAPGINVVKLVNILGGTTFIVPPHWNIKVEVTGILGAFSDNRKHITDISNSDRTLIISGTAILGGGEIKSY